MQEFYDLIIIDILLKRNYIVCTTLFDLLKFSIFVDGLDCESKIHIEGVLWSLKVSFLEFAYSAEDIFFEYDIPAWQFLIQNVAIGYGPIWEYYHSPFVDDIVDFLISKQNPFCTVFQYF